MIKAGKGHPHAPTNRSALLSNVRAAVSQCNVSFTNRDDLLVSGNNHPRYGNRQCMKKEGPWTVQIDPTPSDIQFDDRYNKCKYRKAAVAWTPPFPPDEKGKKFELRDMSVTIMPTPSDGPTLGKPCATIHGIEHEIKVTMKQSVSAHVFPTAVRYRRTFAWPA